MEVRKDFF